ncbi:MAG: MerR family transcriptional regulator [Lachnospiraceae bacterium]|nr:MerR family transcriptional regulator [Lachnospiraceae bacterium]
MNKVFNIGEIADFFDLPASTLRYWEEKGIITPTKSPENHYREYTVSDLMTISDIIFYKNLGIPLKQILEMEKTTPYEHQLLLKSKVKDLELQQKELELRIKKLHCRLNAIDTLKELQMHPFTEAHIDTDCIVPFDLLEIDKLRQYIENPYLYSRVQHSDNLENEQRGLTIPLDLADHIPAHHKLWENNQHKFVVCLMKEQVCEGFPNNLSELLAHVRQKYKTGYIISRFLLCAREDGVLYDFYKTFIEIIL